MSGFAVIIATHGDPSWGLLALERAGPSVGGQGATEVILVHDPDGTLASARNSAAGDVKKSSWLCFLDADDELAPGYLQAMSKAIGPHLLNGTAEKTLYAPAVSYVVAGVQTDPAIPNEGGWPRLNECVIGTLIHRDLFTEVGGFREFPTYEDWDLWLRCTKAGAEVVHVPEAVYLAHYNPAGRNQPDLDSYNRIWAEYAA